MEDVLTPDICVIGGGAGGLAVATEARAHGASVVLIERGRLGGGTLNTGSLPSKALIAAARRAHYLRTAGPFGIANDQPKINARGVFDHIQAVIGGVAPVNSAERLRALGVTVIAAEAKFIDRRTVEAGDRLIRARRFVMAPGSRPFIPAIDGLDAVPYFTNESIFDNPRKLTHLVIIGGGPVGMELAQAFRRLGSDVTVVELASAITNCDPELAEIALRRVTEDGVVIRTGTLVRAVQLRSLGIGVTIKSGESEETLDASHILVAAGRVPSLDGLDLDKAGIRRRKNGTQDLVLKPNLKTTNRRVYAIGDVTGAPRHTHAATYQARLVVRNALFGMPARYDPSLVPRVIFTDPEIAEVGLTEPMLRRAKRDNFTVLRLSFAENDRARAERQTYGLVKLVTDRGGQLLGAGVVGTGAGEMISLFALAVANGLSARHFLNYVAPYPTLAEIAVGLAAEFTGQQPPSPWLRRLMALNRLLP